jgi:hypothetical protein
MRDGVLARRMAQRRCIVLGANIELARKWDGKVMSESWQLDGEYFESCNCELLCPCLLVKGSKPTEGHCDVVVAFHIKSGIYGNTDLSGLNAVTVIYTPGIMTEGKWTMGSYVDERANDARRSRRFSLRRPAARSPASLRSSRIALPARSAAISFVSEGTTRRLSIKNVTEVTVEGVAGANGEQVWFDNVAHFASKQLAAAKSTLSHFKDQGLSFENTGRNGHFADIHWSNA